MRRLYTKPMLPPSLKLRTALLLLTFALVPALLTGQRGGRGANSPFPGGTNPDGSLRPTPPVTSLFTQDAWTEYSILAPGTESFRVKFLPEESRAGATELVNATRGGSEGSDVEVFDPAPVNLFRSRITRILPTSTSSTPNSRARFLRAASGVC